MFKLTHTITRKDSKVFIVPATIFALYTEYYKKLTTAPGFITRTRTDSVDELTIVVVDEWQDEESYNTFISVNSDIFNSVTTDINTYYAANDITSIKTTELV